MFSIKVAFITALLTASAVNGQLPATPQYDQIVKGQLGDGFQTSIKQNNVCETTPGVKTYSGYITTPPSANSNTTVNSFYWFFESRQDPANAPFVIWIGGGPGFNSISFAVGELGPCIVNADSNSTMLNPWSFNNNANVLFIDQPVQSGYSYNDMINGTVNQLDPAGVFVTPLPEGSPVPIANASMNVGRFPSQTTNSTSNSTENAAVVFWQDVQTWFQAFPQYIPKNKSLNLWSGSYGGRYVPLFARYFQTQNELIKQGKLNNSAAAFTFDSIGLENGYIDALSYVQSYVDYAVNNTYGIRMVNSSVEDQLRTNLTKPGGCIDQILACQQLEAQTDPQDSAGNTTIDDICAAGFLYCDMIQTTPVALSGLAQDDIAQPKLASVVGPYYNGFFAQGWVMSALGAAVNFTDNALGPLQAFTATGDFARAGQLQDLGKLLDAGTRVTLLYGDRDYDVNWFGGENASLAMQWRGQQAFQNAGYANFTTNQTYTGGLVRQAGRLGFVRVFQSGHQVGYYQPETLYRIFQRTLDGTDLSDGVEKVDDCGNYTMATQGPREIRSYTEMAPQPAPQQCYVLSAPLTCTPAQLEVLGSGKAVISDFILQEDSGNATVANVTHSCGCKSVGK